MTDKAEAPFTKKYQGEERPASRGQRDSRPTGNLVSKPGVHADVPTALPVGQSLLFPKKDQGGKWRRYAAWSLQRPDSGVPASGWSFSLEACATRLYRSRYLTFRRAKLLNEALTRSSHSQLCQSKDSTTIASLAKRASLADAS